MNRPLTARQRDVVALLIQGLTCPGIARRLHLSPSTVRQHVRDIASHLPGTQPPIRRILAHARGLLDAA
jgi:DNA-binding NarL/FixJ family response regulator